MATTYNSKQIPQTKVTLRERVKKSKQEATVRRQKKKHAERIGYSSGANDYETLPKVKGATACAKKGYDHALKDGTKRDKFNKRLREGKNYKNQSSFKK